MRNKQNMKIKYGVIYLEDDEHDIYEPSYIIGGRVLLLSNH